MVAWEFKKHPGWSSFLSELTNLGLTESSEHKDITVDYVIEKIESRGLIVTPEERNGIARSVYDHGVEPPKVIGVANISYANAKNILFNIATSRHQWFGDAQGGWEGFAQHRIREFPSVAGVSSYVDAIALMQDAYLAGWRSAKEGEV